MNRILITDFILVEAHRYMNIDLIRSFANNAIVDVISVNGYYNDCVDVFRNERIHIIDVRVDSSRTGMIRNRLFSIKIMIIVQSIILANKYDLVISLGFETLAFSLKTNFSGNIPVAVLHHKNIDELRCLLKRMVFNLYKNSVSHLVFEEYFAKYLVEKIQVRKELVHVVGHPVYVINTGLNTNATQYDCVGLCGSNSEYFINKIIKIADVFEKEEIRILLRTKKEYSLFTNYVKLIKGYFSRSDYDVYLNSTRAVLVALPDSYVYRLSGSIYDAFAHRKIVLTTSWFYGKEYGDRYPGICLHISDELDFLNKLKNLKYDDSVENSFQKFLNDHTIGNISLRLRYIIKEIIKAHSPKTIN